MFSEAAAAWHSNANLVASQRNTQVELQRAWWSDVILNQSFWEQHPRMKAYYHFEYDKFENDGGVVDERDYRLSNNSDVLNAFLADLAPVRDMFVYGNSTLQFGQPAINTSVFEITPSGPIATATATVSGSAITATYTQVSTSGFQFDSANHFDLLSSFQVLSLRLVTLRQMTLSLQHCRQAIPDLFPLAA